MEFSKRFSYKKAALLVAVNVLIISTQVLSVASAYRYTSFQKGVICNSTQEPLQPTSLADIQKIVATALESNYSLKALGNKHSASDIICTDGVAVDMKGINHFHYDNSTGQATVGAGATLGAFLRLLHMHGRTIYGVPTYEDVTIGGVIGTGSHGTSFGNPSSLSDLLVGVVVIDGLGQVRTITDDQTIRAFKAHLGLLGIVYEVTVTTIPQYKVQIENELVSDEILESAYEIMKLARAHERFQFFWFPTFKQVVLSKGSHVADSTPGECETHFIPEASLHNTTRIALSMEYMQSSRDHFGFEQIEDWNMRSFSDAVPDKIPMFTEDGKTFCEPAVGYSHRMLTNRCEKCFWNNGNESVFQFEFAAAIPLSELPSAIHTIAGILQTYPIEFPMTGINFRFLSASDGLMTLSSDYAAVSVEWVLVSREDRFNKPMMGLSSSQAIMQALIEKHGGKAHWGKNGPLYTRRDIVIERFRHLRTFLRYMDSFDPQGIFLNDFGRRLKYGSTRTSLDSYAEHCALVDSCVCQTDKDCGDGGDNGVMGTFKCAIMQDYRVCKEGLSKFEYLDEVDESIKKFEKYARLIFS